MKLSELVRYSHWSLNYLMADSKRIYQTFTEMEKSLRDKQKKVLLVTDKRDSIQMMCNLMEGRFLSQK